MKKIILTVVFATTSLFFANAQSENYKLIEWEIFGAGVSVPFQTGLSAGPAFHGALRANVTDQIQVGIRGQAAVYASSLFASIGASAGYFLTGDYRFVKGYKDFRPFVGIGLGYLGGASVSVGVASVSAGAGLGAQLRAGFQYKFIRIAADYTNAFATGGISSFNLGLGFVLFGGQKNK